jgi:hypothetical protein
VWSTPKTWERRAVPFPAVLADELSALMVGKTVMRWCSPTCVVECCATPIGGLGCSNRR